ncbi:MAG: hypothetical protein M1827_007151 [Pycnora praestabilis]|nr:MAG: hypothetical protein M1827_007151 [Pycnora praestabilis]
MRGGLFVWQHQLQRALAESGQSQPYSTVVSSRSDDVKVKVGSSGHVVVNIHHPLTGSGQHSPIILYLPKGPITSTALNPFRSNPNEVLPSYSNATIVQINYRLSTSRKFPSPIHDVLAGFDWVVKHLLPIQQAQARIGIYGGLIGGSLATALALTECHYPQTKRPSISALAAHDPILDWTGLSSTATSRKLSSKLKATPGTAPEQEQTDALLAARNAFFSAPASYHDPFASPLLFFRTASTPLPASQSVADMIAEMSITGNPSSFKSPDIEIEECEREMEGVRQSKHRKYHLRYPPVALSLRLPYMRISMNSNSVLREQGLEFAKCVRRSIGMYEQERSAKLFDNDDDENFDEEEGERRVRIVEGNAGHDMMEVGRWFDDVLR